MGFLKPGLFTRRCRPSPVRRLFRGVVSLATDHWSLLLVRDHPLHLVKIRITYQHGIPQLFLALLGLRGQDVAEKRFVARHFSRPGFLEALGSAFVRF